jgi:acyl carrier protein
VPKTELLAVIQKIIAEQLHKPVEDVKPDDTFAKLGADELDLVEITMAVEDRLGIEISDEKLVKAAGAASSDNLAESLTVKAFAASVGAAPKAGEHEAERR